MALAVVVVLVGFSVEGKVIGWHICAWRIASVTNCLFQDLRERLFGGLQPSLDSDVALAEVNAMAQPGSQVSLQVQGKAGAGAKDAKGAAGGADAKAAAVGGADANGAAGQNAPQNGKGEQSEEKGNDKQGKKQAKKEKKKAQKEKKEEKKEKAKLKKEKQEAKIERQEVGL